MLAALLASVCLPVVAASAGSTAERQASQQIQPYRLGSGDKVGVTTFGEPSLSGAFEVDGDGMVAFPLIGGIKAGGLTAQAFGQAIEAALRDGFLKDPKVSVEVATYRPFYILGEVTRPGEYPYSNGLTMMNAVATASGFTYRADIHHVYVKQIGDPVERKLVLTPATPVEPGETIRIRERYF